MLAPMLYLSQDKGKEMINMNKQELYAKLEELTEMVGTEELLDNLVKALPADELEENLKFIDHMFDTGVFEEEEEGVSIDDLKHSLTLYELEEYIDDGIITIEDIVEKGKEENSTILKLDFERDLNIDGNINSYDDLIDLLLTDLATQEEMNDMKWDIVYSGISYFISRETEDYLSEFEYFGSVMDIVDIELEITNLPEKFI